MPQENGRLLLKCLNKQQNVTRVYIALLPLLTLSADPVCFFFGINLWLNLESSLI